MTKNNIAIQHTRAYAHAYAFAFAFAYSGMTSENFDAIASALHGPKVVDIFEGCMRSYGFKRTDVLAFFEMIADGDRFEAEMPKTWKTVNTKFSKIYTLRQACAVPVLPENTQRRALSKLDDMLKKIRDQKKACCIRGGAAADVTVVDVETDVVAVADDVVASVSMPEYTWRTEQERTKRALANAREAEAKVRLETECIRVLELRVRLAEFQARKQEAYVRRMELSSREKMNRGRPSGVVEHDVRT